MSTQQTNKISEKKFAATGQPQLSSTGQPQPCALTGNLPVEGRLVAREIVEYLPDTRGGRVPLVPLESGPAQDQIAARHLEPLVLVDSATRGRQPKSGRHHHELQVGEHEAAGLLGRSSSGARDDGGGTRRGRLEALTSLGGKIGGSLARYGAAQSNVDHRLAHDEASAREGCCHGSIESGARG